MRKGSKHSAETKKKMLGNKNAGPNSGRYVRTTEIREKISRTLKSKGCKPPKRDMRRKNNPAWKGGVSCINRRIRRSKEYQLWRKAIFERDGYKCIWCGIKSGCGKAVILHADHIKPFAHYPELRLAIDNGRTLCRECHKTTETYGGKIKSKNRKS